MSRQGQWVFGYSDHKGHLAELGELLHLYRRKCGVKISVWGWGGGGGDSVPQSRLPRDWERSVTRRR